MNVRKITTYLPVSDEMLDDARPMRRVMNRLMTRLTLSWTPEGAARLAAEDRIGHALAMRTPRWLPLLARLVMWRNLPPPADCSWCAGSGRDPITGGACRGCR